MSKAFLMGRLFIFGFLFFLGDFLNAQEVTLKSPDEKLAVILRPGERLSYSIKFKDKDVIENAEMGITIDGDDLGKNVEFSGNPSTVEINETFPVAGGHSKGVTHCQSSTLGVTSGTSKTAWQLEVRVFNDGVGYRYRVPGSGKRKINGESSEWKVPLGSQLWYQKSSNRSYEDRYTMAEVGKLPDKLAIMAAATLKLPDGLGYLTMTEANVVNYSDMALEAEGERSFRALFHDDPKGWSLQGEIVSPWRVTLVSADLNGLVNSDIIQSLCPPPSADLVGAEWIKPGRSIWHWLTGGPPKLEEQKDWIDGTKNLGFEYYLIDDGWKGWKGGGERAWGELEDLVKYANKIGVNIWVWVHCKDVFKEQDRKECFKRMKKMGVVGMKIDFMDPANVDWVNWYDEVLKDAAEEKMMINFHGCTKPSGRERTWPNEMTREGIAGREQGRNSYRHDTAVPFVRYVQGHADYTPVRLGSELHQSSITHEIAMAVVFTSPYFCYGDHPKNYLGTKATDILRNIPSVWDETIVLPESEIGEMAAYARRKGDQWFIGVINGPEREIKVPLKFLAAGEFQLIELKDIPGKGKNTEFERVDRAVTAQDTLVLPMRADGGYVAWLRPAGVEIPK
jgi:alpha-glucosidase